MNALLAFLPKPLLFWGTVGLAILVGIQTIRVGSMKTKLGVAAVAVEQCVTTNAANKETIQDLKDNTNACLDGRRADEQAHNNALVAWTVERELLKVRADEKADDVVEVFRDPTCADFAKVNITDICPGMVDGLRRRAESHNRIRDGN